jgi:CHRD domain
MDRTRALSRTWTDAKFAALKCIFGNKANPGLLEDGHHHVSTGRESMTRIMYATLALGAAVAFAGPAFADKYKATLDAKSEVPPNASTASGTADLDYDAASKKLSWKITYSGLTGPASAAHFHGPAEAGKNAGVEVAIPNAGTSPVEGSATLTDAQAADLTGGKLYINFHTAANPGGEIRGQVVK